MKFKLDENLPQETGALFRDFGFDAVSAGDQQLGGAEDPEIYAVCQRERRVLITLDIGFGNIQNYPPEESAGVIVLRLKQQSRPAVLAVIRSLLALLRQAYRGRLWIAGEHSIRVRS